MPHYDKTDATPTPRTIVALQRAAYIKGCTDAGAHERVAYHNAERAYPMPTVTRPRFVSDPTIGIVRWSVLNGVLCGESGDCGHWYDFSLGHSAYTPTAARVAIWADLFANPTEEVEA